MTKSTQQFIAFLAAMLGFAAVGGLMIKEPWTRGLELPIGILWIVGLLGTIGFIVSGRDGAKALVSSTLLMWLAALVGAAFIAWMALAGAGHSL
ncbi:hypothetical protein [Rhizobium sp. BK251]|uniref:hypothetical protein n=1 Tax=Rhizobium sp. BK251 TaxID=2512125 RepID=UPI001050A2B5|nr:hypothetical protein [Rhizobium sp. BK251]